MHRKAQISSNECGTSKDIKVMVRCFHCKSQNFAKWGQRKTKQRGIIQTYKCLDCKKRFTNDEGFYRMKNPEDKITQGIDLYFSNLSSRKVRNHFRRHRTENASHETILRWCRKYVLKVSKFTDELQPQLSGQFYADETEIDCENRNDYLWCNVDWGTRFINGFHYSTTRGTEEAIEFLLKTTKNGKPKYIQTDAASFYPKAMHKLFYSQYASNGNRQDKLSFQHIVNNVSKTKKHNVRIETVFSKIKDRTEDFRGLKALWSAPILLKGIVLQHNFIEAHTTTGQVPCELAGLNQEFGVNRWLGLIRLASVPI